MSNVLIVTGMHRSATSLIASMFQRAGVAFGARLLQADERNPRGFFEDVEFYEFHQSVLRARGESILVDRAFSFAPTSAEQTHAEALLAARASQELWGWKDPRTSLCLEFWRERLAAQDSTGLFVLVYRHPFDVLLSLMRRNDWDMPGLLEAMEAWYAYNRALVEFRGRYPAQTLLCNCYTVIDEIEAFDARLAEKWGLRLNFDASARAAQYHADELRRADISPPLDRILECAHPDAMALYARMNELADLPALTRNCNNPAPGLDALAHYAEALGDSPDISARRGLLFALTGLCAPGTLESFLHTQAEILKDTQKERERLANELAARGRAYDELQLVADERARLLQEQSAWVEPRMNDLRALEAHPLVRLVRRLGYPGHSNRQ